MPEHRKVTTGNEKIMPQDHWQDAMRSGLSNARSGDHEGALCHLRRAAELRPDHLPTLNALCAGLVRAGRAAEAIDHCTKALAVAPDDIETHHILGQALCAMDATAQALDTLRRASWINPEAWKVWTSIADITRDMGERQDARLNAARALEAACRMPDASSDLRIEAARAIARTGRLEDALRFLLANFGKIETGSSAHDLLARIYYRLGMFRHAFEQASLAFDAMSLCDIPPEPSRIGLPTDMARIVLGDLLALLANAGIAAFPVGGALLGLWRNGALMATDRDIDIGILRGPAGSPDLTDLILSNTRFRLSPTARPGDRYLALSCKTVAVDIFVYEPIQDHFLCGFSDVPGDIQWRFTPFALARASFDGLSCLVPAGTAQYLAECYGQSWHEPDPGFASAISSPALFGTDPHARAYYSLSRARQCLLAGDLQKARSLLHQSPIPCVRATRRIGCALNSKHMQTRAPIGARPPGGVRST